MAHTGTGGARLSVQYYSGRNQSGGHRLWVWPSDSSTMRPDAPCVDSPFGNVVEWNLTPQGELIYDMVLSRPFTPTCIRMWLVASENIHPNQRTRRRVGECCVGLEGMTAGQKMTCKFLDDDGVSVATYVFIVRDNTLTIKHNAVSDTRRLDSDIEVVRCTETEGKLLASIPQNSAGLPMWTCTTRRYGFDVVLPLWALSRQVCAYTTTMYVSDYCVV